MSQQVSIPAPPPSASQSKRFECSIPGCVKVFRRKEHLTRHQKSHNTELPYVCNICGRRYARSDVLKRHVEFHPQYYKPRRNFVACVRCRESKTRCDDKTTCMACHRKSVECVRPEPEPHVIVGDSTSKAFPDLSAPAAPKSHLDKLPDDVDLEQYVLRETASVMSRFQVYFSIIHPIWPILNPPSSPTDVYPSTLTMSVVMLASWIEGDNDHLTLAPWIFGQLSNVDLNPDPPLHMLQTMVLCMVYALSNLVAEGMASRALKLHNTLVTLCRCAGILDGQNGTFNQVRKASTPVEVQEQRHRIALAALRIDAYFSVLTDMPPLIRFQELVMPLTATAIWTNAINDEEGRTLGERQTMMRKKTTFAFLVSDMLGVPRQNEMAPRWTKMDYHFVLCGLQSGVWESGHYALRSVADELYSRSRHEHPRPAGRQRLENWSLSLETDCQ
ncbi:hypothetical protein F5Y16DRAFT_151047 [Xylariaceae sp. FL0255]|nr:hypothetical protein F5Y16DRAFT_151047 [Xylariaceae sp. FL0255]